MADTGESFNVARRKVEAATAGQVPEGEDRWELIEIEVGTEGARANRRHIETFWGRWVLAPDSETTHTMEPGHPEGAYYGVAQTRQGRIAIYTAMSNPLWPGRLDDYDTLADAQMPEDIRRQTAAALGIREVIHRDI